MSDPRVEEAPPAGDSPGRSERLAEELEASRRERRRLEERLRRTIAEKRRIEHYLISVLSGRAYQSTLLLRRVWRRLRSFRLFR